MRRTALILEIFRYAEVLGYHSDNTSGSCQLTPELEAMDLG